MAHLPSGWAYFMATTMQRENENIRDFVEKIHIIRDIAYAEGHEFTDGEFAEHIVIRLQPSLSWIAHVVLDRTSYIDSAGIRVILYGRFIDSLCKIVEAHLECIQNGIYYYNSAENIVQSLNFSENYQSSLHYETATVDAVINEMNQKVIYLYDAGDMFLTQADQLVGIEVYEL